MNVLVASVTGGRNPLPTDLDPRSLVPDGVKIWHDGTCLRCGGPTYETGDPWLNAEAPTFARVSEALASAGADRGGDYYLWCGNNECQNHGGERMYDTECPPEWANHEGRA
jgi:hypothetical protein